MDRARLVARAAQPARPASDFQPRDPRRIRRVQSVRARPDRLDVIAEDDRERRLSIEVRPVATNIIRVHIGPGPARPSRLLSPEVPTGAEWALEETASGHGAWKPELGFGRCSGSGALRGGAERPGHPRRVSPFPHWARPRAALADRGAQAARGVVRTRGTLRRAGSSRPGVFFVDGRCLWRTQRPSVQERPPVAEFTRVCGLLRHDRTALLRARPIVYGRLAGNGPG